jgi:PAS domain S-box-containing protein
MVFVRPVLEVGLAGPITVFWIAVRPVMGLVLLWLSFHLILLDAASHEISTLRILGLAILVTAISDLSNSYIFLMSFSRSASLVEAGWMGANLLFLEVGRRMRKSSAGEHDAIEDDLQPRPHSLEPLLPIVLTYAVVGYSAFDWWFSGQVDWLGVGTAVVLSLMLVARQGVIVGQSELSQFVALVNDSADMAFICEQDGLIRLANPALRQAIGVPPSVGENFHLADFLVDGDGTSALISQAQKDGWTGEVWFRHRNGHTLPVSLSLRSVSLSPQPKTLLAATAHDLTIIREREISLRTALNEVAEARGELEALNVKLEDKIGVRTRELESTVAEMAVLLEELKVLDRMKMEFVALVSHELRAPLTNILSGVELILDSEHELTLSARESLILVQEETQRLARFVKTVLDMSALEAGQFPIRFTPISIEDVARKVYGRFLETEGSERLCLDLPHDLPDVLADEQALDSVFFHLLDNAFKYTSEGEISIEAWAEGIYVYVAICDAGPGIPSNERERVFDMFHRVDARDSREVYGYGLGLPMARRFMEAMEGGIKVEDGPRGGARLVFWLKQAV